jgi:hypothetical protein
MPTLHDVPSLPLHLDDLTPAWVTSALAESFPGIEVAGVSRDREYFGTAASARVGLTLAEGSAPGPASIHIKGGFDDAWRQRVWMALQQEVRFYADIAPSIELNLPEVHYLGVSDEPQGIIVLEDLVARGVTFGQNLAPTTPDQVAASLERIAPMHAAWWQSPRLASMAGWQQPQRTFLRWLFRPKHWDILTDYENGDLLVEAVGTRENAIAALDRLWAVNDAAPATFLHGDLHGGNIFYEADGRPGFLDWQLCFAGTYSHDMSWLIVTALDIEQRRAHERDLVEVYRQALTAAMLGAPSFDQMWLAYRQNMVHAIASYGCVPRDSGPEDIVKGSALRAFTAAIDHDPLEALGISR